MTHEELLKTPGGKTAFVLAGGGSLGAVQVGMLKALVEAAIMPDMMVGASVGAINAAYFAGRPSLEGALGLEQVWLKLKRTDIFPLSAMHGLLAFISRRNSFVSPHALTALIHHELTFKKLEDAAIPLHVVATDALDGAEVVISTGRADTALLASTAIPGIFPPVKLGRKLLIDGGVTNNTPIPAAVALGAERIIVLPTGSACASPGLPSGALPLILHSLNLMVISQLVRDIHYFSDKAEIIVVPPLCPLETNISDFSKTAEIMKGAYENTKHWLKHTYAPEIKVPHQLRLHHHATEV